MGSRVRARRRQLDRAGVAARTGSTPATVDYWCLQRATTRFPAHAEVGADGRYWWWQDDIDAFHTAHLQSREALFTEVDRTGHPDDLLTSTEAAAVLGYRNHRSLPRMLTDNPDHTEPLPSGRRRRFWYRRTVWDFADGRVLRHSTGRPEGTTNTTHVPHPYADDPRLDAACALLAETRTSGTGDAGLGAELARRLGINPRTGRRLIAAARLITPVDARSQSNG